MENNEEGKKKVKERQKMIIEIRVRGEERGKQGRND